MDLFCYVLVILYERSKKKKLTLEVLNWAGKWNWWWKMYMHTRAIVSQIPRKMLLSWNRHRRSAIIRQQLKTKDQEIIRQNLANLLSRKNMVMRYECLPIRGTRYLTSGLGIEKGKRPDHVWSCVGPHTRTKFISFVAHKVKARDACSEVEWWDGELGTGKCSQCERVQMRESSSNVYWDILLCF